MEENSTIKYNLTEAQRYNRERYIVYVVMWSLSCLIHVGLFYVGGLIVDWRTTTYEIKMNWSDESLNGFGMMSAFEPMDDIAPEEVLNDIEPPDEDENPFEEKVVEVKPDLDASKIEAPAEPEPEPDPNAEPDPEAKPKDEKPAHDLSRDAEKLAAVRADVSGLPNLHVLAPGNAKLIVLIRNDRVQGSRFEQAVRRLYKSFPDYRFTLGKADIDPITDINAMLIATANPNLYAETFLVVSHKIPAEMLKKSVSEAFPSDITWGEYNGRPIATPNSADGRFNPRSGIYKRSVYLPDDNTVLFLKPEVLPTLNVPHIDAIVETRDEDVENQEEAATFLQTLGGISTSDSPSMPTLFMAVQGIDTLKLGGSFPEFPPPAAVQASLSTEANPHLNLVATFATSDDAEAFNSAWPEIVSAAGGMGIPGLSGILKGLALTAESNQVLVSGDLNGSMISLILMFASKHLSDA